MGKSIIDKQILKDFIINNVSAHEKDIVSFAANEFEVSRQTVYRYMKHLIDTGVIEALGEKRIQNYKLKTQEYAYTFEIDDSLTEEIVWLNYVRPLIQDIQKNVLDICDYGVGEMVNNVVDHSGAPHLQIEVMINALEIVFTVKDDGVGIFTKIQQDFSLADKKYAILELAKGKLTSDPDNHTGEGIFFTSKMFDKFLIFSDELVFTDIDDIDLLLPDRKKIVEGTKVFMIIKKISGTNITDVFDKFTPGSDSEDFGFQKTIIPVKLLLYEGDSALSRSQAKRLIARFDQFKEVILDFEGVNLIGQAFADEVFRIFPKKHSGTNLHTINTNENINKMIKHVKSN